MWGFGLSHLTQMLASPSTPVRQLRSTSPRNKPHVGLQQLLFFAFFDFYSVVRQDLKVHSTASFIFLLIITRSGLLVGIKWSIWSQIPREFYGSHLPGRIFVLYCCCCWLWIVAWNHIASVKSLNLEYLKLNNFVHVISIRKEQLKPYNSTNKWFLLHWNTY